MNQQPLRWFVSVFNKAKPDWKDRDLKQSDVKFSYTTSYWAKCGPRYDENEVYFAYNKDWWSKNTNPNHRIGLLIHEVGHYEYPHHRPSFHDEVVSLFKNIHSNIDVLANELSEDLESKAISEWLIEDKENSIVDKRQQTPYDARKEFANRVSYPITESKAFEGVLVTRASQMKYNTHTTDRISIDNIMFDTATRSEVSDWLTNPNKKFVSVVSQKDKNLYNSDSLYVLDPIPVKQLQDGLFKPKTEDARMAFSLAEHKNYQKVEAKVENQIKI